MGFGSTGLDGGNKLGLERRGGEWRACEASQGGTQLIGG